VDQTKIELKLSLSNRVFLPGIITVFTLIFIYVTPEALRTEQYGIFLGHAMMAFFWYKIIRAPFRIILDKGQVTFCAIVGRYTVSVANIVRVEATSISVKFHTSDRNFETINELTGLHRLLTEISSRNPKVEMSGC
jgi:hypothetical protein